MLGATYPGCSSAITSLATSLCPDQRKSPYFQLVLIDRHLDIRLLLALKRWQDRRLRSLPEPNALRR